MIPGIVRDGTRFANGFRRIARPRVDWKTRERMAAPIHFPINIIPFGRSPLSPRPAADIPSMLKPTVQVHNINGVLVAEFWECLRLDPAPIVELRKKYEAHVGEKGRP